METKEGQTASSSGGFMRFYFAVHSWNHNSLDLAIQEIFDFCWIYYVVYRYRYNQESFVNEDEYQNVNVDFYFYVILWLS